jgi:phosphoglycolate phosphatase
MAEKTIVLFDLDGTLIDTAPDMYLALGILLNEEAMPNINYEDVRSQVSNGVLGIFSVAFTDDPGTENERYDRYLDIYEAVLGQKSKLFENTVSLLDRLDDRGIDYGVVTNKSSRFTTPLLEEHELLYRLKTLVCGDQVKKRKPDPEPLIKALEKIPSSYEYDNVYYVGDAEKDVVAAKAANIKSIACSYGYRDVSDKPSSWKAEYVINDLIQVNEIV